MWRCMLHTKMIIMIIIKIMINHDDDDCGNECDDSLLYGEHEKDSEDDDCKDRADHHHHQETDKGSWRNTVQNLYVRICHGYNLWTRAFQILTKRAQKAQHADLLGWFGSSSLLPEICKLNLGAVSIA